MLIPTDFYKLINGDSVLSPNGIPIRPWVVLSPTIYRLSLSIFYDTGVWRDLSVYFDTSGGYSFHSGFYLNNSKPTDAIPEMITRNEWDDQSFCVSSIGDVFGEVIPPNHPPMIEWLLKNDLIRSVGPKGNQAATFLSKLAKVWVTYRQQSLVAEHTAATEMVLLGNNVYKYFTIIKVAEQKVVPVFTSLATIDSFSDYFPNLDLHWERWGQDYIVNKAKFQDKEGKDCSAYVGYSFVPGEKPWWQTTYITSLGKVVVVDNSILLLQHLAECGVISRRYPFSRELLPDISKSFKGAIRTAIDPQFFLSKRVFTNAEFYRY